MPMAQPNGSDSQDDRLAVYILAGGRSTRFGRDKATFEVQGTPMIVHLAQTFAPLARSVTVVAAGAGVYEHLGLRTIGDVIEGKGPVGGLLTALQDHRNQIRVAGAREGYNFREGWILVSACDWVGVRTDWVNKLTAQRHDGAQAVVFRAQRFEPLLGLYHTSACDTIASRMAADKLDMQGLLAEIAAVHIPRPSDWATMTNVNRPSDLDTSQGS